MDDYHRKQPADERRGKILTEYILELCTEHEVLAGFAGIGDNQ